MPIPVLVGFWTPMSAPSLPIFYRNVVIAAETEMKRPSVRGKTHGPT